MRAAAAALLVLLALSGCSGGDGGGDGDQDGPGDEGTTTGPASTSTTTTSASTTTSSSSSASSAPAAPQTHERAIEGNSFVDGTFTVRKGDTVRWTQRDSVPHSVTEDGGAFDSNPVGCPPVCMVSGQTFEHTFAEAGEFPYHCKVHASMTGTITVQA